MIDSLGLTDRDALEALKRLSNRVGELCILSVERVHSVGEAACPNIFSTLCEPHFHNGIHPIAISQTPDWESILLTYRDAQKVWQSKNKKSTNRISSEFKTSISYVKSADALIFYRAASYKSPRLLQAALKAARR